MDKERMEYIERLVRKRNQAMWVGDYLGAGKVRERLAAMGIILEDTSSGTVWRVDKWDIYLTKRKCVGCVSNFDGCRILEKIGGLYVDLKDDDFEIVVIDCGDYKSIDRE